MAKIVVSTVTSTPRVLVALDDVLIARGGQINVTTGTAISAAGPDTDNTKVIVEGSVSAMVDSAIVLQGNQTDVHVGTTGSVTSFESAAIIMDGAGLDTVKVSNDGWISGSAFGVIAKGDRILVSNSGTTYGALMAWSVSGSSADLANSGTLTGGVSSNTNFVHFVNTGTVLSTLERGFSSGRAGAFTSTFLQNTGVISSTQSNAMSVQAGTNGSSAVFNSGTMSGSLSGLADTSADSKRLTVSNSGSIIGMDGQGVRSTSAFAIITNDSGGNISSVSDTAIEVTKVLTLTNGGTIATQSITDAAILIGAGGSTSSVTNSGTISAIEGNAAISSGIVVGSFTLTNHGVIDGRVDLAGGNNRVFNAGTITGVLTFGDGTDTYTAKGDGTATVLGGGGNDRLTGAMADDVFGGGLGNDTLSGNAGSDSLNGDDGNDALSGGDGDDLIVGGLGTDSILGGAGDDSMTGDVGADTLTGGGGADDLFGGADSDRLLGGDGDDVLFGGLGKDVLIGGSGADVFVFATAAESGAAAATADVIRDFQKGVDVIDLSDILPDNALFMGPKPFKSGIASLSYVAATGLLSIDANGDKVADMAILLSNKPVLTVGDFLF